MIFLNEQKFKTRQWGCQRSSYVKEPAYCFKNPAYLVMPKGIHRVQLRDCYGGAQTLLRHFNETLINAIQAAMNRGKTPVKLG
jgi:hypothetical protein